MEPTQDEIISFLPRKNKAGAGRPTKYGCKTHVLRVPETVDTEKMMKLLDLEQIMAKWAEYVENNPKSDSPRYYFLKQMLDDYRAIGLDEHTIILD